MLQNKFYEVCQQKARLLAIQAIQISNTRIWLVLRMLMLSILTWI